MEYLSFQGGGVHGIYYVGVCKYLEDHNLLKNLKGVSGSSIGSLFALLFAMKLKYEDMKNIISELDFNNVIGLNAFDQIKAFYKIINNFGILSRTNLEKIVSEILIKYCGNKNITFIEFYKKFNMDLVVTITNVNKMQTRFISYKREPDYKVLDIVCISMSVPIYFETSIIDEEYYCDGSVLCNLPLKVWDTETTKANIFGVIVISPEQLDNNSTEINSIDDYMYNMIGNLNGKASEIYYKDPISRKIDSRVCQIVTDIPFLNKDLTESNIENMIINGYNLTSHFFLTKDNMNSIEIKKKINNKTSYCNLL
jgi:predicted acylesterase/phospholipase RssA